MFENKTKLKLQNNELALGFGVHHLRTSAAAHDRGGGRPRLAVHRHGARRDLAA